MLSVAWLNVVVHFVGDQLLERPMLAFGYAVKDKLVDYRLNIAFAERPAFQQNLAHRKNLAVCQRTLVRGFEAVAVGFSVVHNFSLSFTVGNSVYKKIPYRINIALNSSVGLAESVGFLPFINSLTVYKVGIKMKHTKAFLLGIRIIIAHNIPLSSNCM